MDRRNFLSAGIGLGATLASHRCALSFTDEKPLLRIGLMADAQYADIEPANTRYYRLSVQRLADAVSSFNDWPIDACFHLGDLIDRDYLSFDSILAPLNHLRTRCHQLLGNHDFAVDDQDKQKVSDRMRLERPFYAITMSGYRFLILNGTAVSTYAYPSDDERTLLAADVLAKLKTENAPNAHSWNSGLGDEQIRWLRAQLEIATSTGEPVIIFCHYPVFPANPHNLWDSDEVLGVVDQFACVKAWFNGHNHAGNYGYRNGIHFVTMHGMVETAQRSAFARGALYADRLVLEGFGREPDRSLVWGEPVDTSNTQ